MARPPKAKVTEKRTTSKRETGTRRQVASAQPTRPSSKRVQARATSKSLLESEAPLGLADFRRNGGALIAQVCEDGEPLSIFASAGTPFMRLRSADVDHEEAEDIAEDAPPVSFGRFKRDFLQYRALIMLDEAFLVSADNATVIIDRHPECPSDIVDTYMKMWRTRIRASVNRYTRRDVRRTADGVESLAELIERLLKRLKRRDRERDNRDAEMWEMIKTKIDDSTLTDDERKALRRWRFQQGADVEAKKGAKPTADDLDRTMLD